MRVAFKPTSTIARRQNTVSRDGLDVELLAKGRHDPCVVPRAVPMVEAMVAITLADQLLQVCKFEYHPELLKDLLSDLSDAVWLAGAFSNSTVSAEPGADWCLGSCIWHMSA